jgi:hypothetical protein
MNCQQANQIDLVDHLASLGYMPDKIRNSDYWYKSPLRPEKNASFKVNRVRNIWYDHGEGAGGNVVDFAMRYYKCDLSGAIERISSSITANPNTEVVTTVDPGMDNTNRLVVINTISPIENQSLIDYINFRNIDPVVAGKFCREIIYENDAKIFRAIGFKNNAGGFELRSQCFKGSTSPKYVSWFNNRATTIAVFEGFFDFLTWQTMNKSQVQKQTNFLILNSLSFFTRSLLLQEKHDRIYLYLDNDNAGRKCAQEIIKRNPGKVVDESRQYKDFKDLNDWFIEKRLDVHVKQSNRLRL